MDKIDSELEKIIQMRTNIDLYAAESRKTLEEKLNTLITSTMVGSLTAVENELGFLWGHNETELSAVQREIKKHFDKLRTSIFDNGNKQIKLMKKELDNYSVGLKQGGVTLPVIKEKNNE